MHVPVSSAGDCRGVNEASISPTVEEQHENEPPVRTVPAIHMVRTSRSKSEV